MRTNHNDRLKTLGPQAARLVTTLYERGRTIFTLAEVEVRIPMNSSTDSGVIRPPIPI